jgi:uncharacterized protein
MTAVTAPPPRIATLDIVRGVAVMGILAMNIVNFAMPPQAYGNPAAYGTEGAADLAAWTLGFVLFEGKMRGLFSLLFGASMLVVIERAEAAGADGAAIHFRRMAWLALIGLLHFYLIWAGDILFGYAMAGMAAWFFHAREARSLVAWGIALILVQLLLFAAIAGAVAMLAAEATASGAAPEAVAAWAGKQGMFGVPDADTLRRTLDLYRGGYGGIVAHRVTVLGAEPFEALLLFSWETVGYMLIGMAALKSGFLRGAWSQAAYRRTARACLGFAMPVYGLYALLLARADFPVPLLLAIGWAGTVPVRLAMIVGLAALIVASTRGGGRLAGRIAAAGRAAFTNYLGTSIVMTTLFYGYGGGLYGHVSRAELWLVVVPMWALMLLWSKPWLERFHYGPAEWLWRSLARGEAQPMRKG